MKHLLGAFRDLIAIKQNPAPDSDEGNGAFFHTPLEGADRDVQTLSQLLLAEVFVILIREGDGDAGLEVRLQGGLAQESL